MIELDLARPPEAISTSNVDSSTMVVCYQDCSKAIVLETITVLANQERHSSWEALAGGQGPHHSSKSAACLGSYAELQPNNQKAL